MGYKVDEFGFVRDYAMRTDYNLTHLSDNRYNVTQLINSAVGLLIIPTERLIKHDMLEYTDDDLYKLLSSKITKNTYKCEQPYPSLNRIISHIRNCICHGKLDLKLDNKGNIDTIVINDNPPCKKEPVLQMELTVGDFTAIYSSFLKALNNNPKISNK